MSQPLIVPVILSGGAGTRLWPSSRNAFPKQFIPLVDARSTFSNTLDRVAVPDVFADPIVVTAWDFRFLVAEELAQAKRKGRVVLEPLRRDSGAAIAVAAHIVYAENPDAIMLVLAADHLVRDVNGFVRSTIAGVNAARAGHIITFGVTPDRPATAYGYIKPGERLDPGVHVVERFIEKPNLEKAKELVAEGCVWNNGNFLFQASTMIGELRKFAPDMEQVAQEAAATRQVSSVGDIRLERIDTDVFARSPSKSIDYAVMEKTTLGAVVSADHDWSDLGSWEALWEVNGKDADGNVTQGAVSLQEARNCYVSSDGLHTAVIGLEGLTVVATHDAVLVAPRHVANELKPLVAMLGSDASTQNLVQRYKRHRTPWGWEDSLVRRTDLVVKHLHVRPGARLALHRHINKRIHYLVVKGTCTVFRDDSEQAVHSPGEFSFEAGEVHRIANAHDDELELIETQTGIDVREDDIVWVADDYGRC